MKKFFLFFVIVILLVGCMKTEKNLYLTDDYVEIKPVTVKIKHEDKIESDDKWNVELSDISFMKLESALISDFIENHNIIINRYSVIDVSAFAGDSDFLKINNDFDYEIEGEVLSIFEKFDNSSSAYQQYSPLIQSLVINLKDMSKLTNESLLDSIGYDVTKMFNLILEDSLTHITVDSLIQSPIGEVTADVLTINDFKANIKEYSKTLYNSKGVNFSASNFSEFQYEDVYGDVISLYYSNNKLRVAYKISPILAALGLSSHMGMGIDEKVQFLDLN